MFKRPVTYENFEGQKVTEEFYFNLSMAEILELDQGYEGGMKAVFEQIVAGSNPVQMAQEFKKIILSAYGRKSEDGRSFLKSADERDAFAQTLAFDALFMEICTNENKAVEFVLGAFPNQLTEDYQKQQAAAKVQDKPTGPPPVPRSAR